MKTKTFDDKGTKTQGNFKVTIMHNDGSKETIRHTCGLDPVALAMMVEKCEIKSFKFELEAIG